MKGSDKMDGQIARTKRRFFRLGDLTVIAVILVAVISGALMIAVQRSGLSEEGRKVAVISVRGEVVQEIELDRVAEPYELEVIGDLTVKLEISDRGARFISSGCPDKLCVRRGLLSGYPDSAVCLPAKVSVKIERRDIGSLPDAVAG